MTNNVANTLRQARPTYLNNSAIGSVSNGIASMFGGAGNMSRMLGGASPTAPNAANELERRLKGAPSANPQDLMKAVQGGLGGLMGGGGTMRIQPVGNPMPITAGIPGMFGGAQDMNRMLGGPAAPTMSTQPVGRPMPINVRNAGTPMNPTAGTRSPLANMARGAFGRGRY